MNENFLIDQCYLSKTTNKIFLTKPITYLCFKSVYFLKLFFLVLGTQVFGVIGDDHTIATSVCIGLASERTYTAAIPRNCNSGRSCYEICRSVADMDEVNDASKP